MCVSVKKYKKVIDTIKEDGYPSTLQFLAEINPSTEPCLKAVNGLVNEIVSLENIENKLTFPSIISVLEKSNGVETFSPNIEQIIKLTHQKHDKIKQLFNTLYEEMKYCDDCSKVYLGGELKKVEANFFAIKEQWLSALHFLTTDEARCKNRVDGNCICDTKEKAIEKLT